MTRAQIDALSERELDALVDSRIMGVCWDESRCRSCGWKLSEEAGGCRIDDCSMRPRPDIRADQSWPHYSTDLNAARTVLEKIGEHSHTRAELCRHLGNKDYWELLTLTPRQLMTAALLAWEEKR